MSALNPIRTRLPRLADAAAVRDRLLLVPPSATRAPRTPFLVLIVSLLVGGVVGLLMFNTNMQQDSFRATALQSQADQLAAQAQNLSMRLQQLRDPQQLAQSAKALGMVVPPNPAFLELGSGRILGVPMAATAADAMQIRPPAAGKPASLNPAPKIVRMPATNQATKSSAKKTASSGAASTAAGRGAGKNGTNSSTTGRGTQSPAHH